ncbi:MAG: hypothetical protein COV10_00810 [Candidatus Vogelbacteria bacterium CG10_big_fil_rev_8_21_14_0_10_51_16]|uniref:Uncharacterized protein n=1 Tax=Candidatus Vogelbacteria bacterium CG10_big_fil_rev_8_21_14_0_10_51_16 TaxID=1975045 RepID=A0A2H0RF62_9BACT|nr:MAG: hypothetical protein COV10_00810 [Candidatus Vogelbacteria bacterium CG10_big_fil_rev_8_21_14_0_10_51_16]
MWPWLRGALTVSNIKSVWLEVNPWRGMMLSMVILVVYGIFALGNLLGALRVLALVVPAGLLLNYALHHLHATPQKGKFPESGFITTLIVSVLMPFDVSAGIALGAITFAILSKHFLRLRGEHLFNPASLGVVGVSLFVTFPLAWWPDGYLWLVILLGLINLWRTRKYVQVATFLLIYFAFLFTITERMDVAALSLPFFFAMFMLPEPVTSQGGLRGQFFFGLIVALGAIVANECAWLAAVALPTGLLVANLSRYLITDPAPKYAITPGFTPQH